MFTMKQLGNHEARFIQSLEKVLEITFQHKAVLGLQ